MKRCVFRGSKLKTERAAPSLDIAVGFVEQLLAHMRDFVVDGFERSIGRHDARQIMLQDCAEDAATNDNNQEPHQDSREGPAEVKAAVEEKDREAQQSEPEMTADPGLRPAETPSGHTLSRAQKRRENHGVDTDDAKEQT